MDIDRYGNFTATIPSDKLVRGLRPSKRTPRNEGYLTQAQGAVGQDGVLQAIESLTRLATATITDAFPFPQIFVFTNVIIVCGLKKLYEWDGSTLTLKYTATTASGPWTAVDFYDCVYLSNGVEAVVRDAGKKTYAIDTDLPAAYALCNFNGQVLAGAPDVGGLGAKLVMPDGTVTATCSVTGTMTTT